MLSNIIDTINHFHCIAALADFIQDKSHQQKENQMKLIKSNLTAEWNRLADFNFLTQNTIFKSISARYKFIHPASNDESINWTFESAGTAFTEKKNTQRKTLNEESFLAAKEIQSS